VVDCFASFGAPYLFDSLVAGEGGGVWVVRVDPFPERRHHATRRRATGSKFCAGNLANVKERQGGCGGEVVWPAGGVGSGTHPAHGLNEGGAHSHALSAWKETPEQDCLAHSQMST